MRESACRCPLPAVASPTQADEPRPATPRQRPFPGSSSPCLLSDPGAHSPPPPPRHLPLSLTVISARLVPSLSTLTLPRTPSVTFPSISRTPLRHLASALSPSAQMRVLRRRAVINCWVTLDKASGSLSVLVCKMPLRTSHVMPLLGQRSFVPRGHDRDSPVRKRLKRHLPSAPGNPRPREVVPPSLPRIPNT